ncbi:MAG TPA: hypothetical protein VIK91_20810, partial [Nannocystis sp.]
VEEFGTKSDDIELVVTGEMPLKDPFTKSEFAFNMKLLVTQALQDKSDTLRFAVQTAGPSTKMDPPDEGWLGFKLRGTVGRPRFMGIKTKTAEERMLERRQKNAEREAAKKARNAKRPSAKKNTEKAEKDSLERNLGAVEAEREASPSTAEPEVRVDPSALPTPPEPERDEREREREAEREREREREEEARRADEREERFEPPPPEEPARAEPEPDGQGQGYGQGEGQAEPPADTAPDGAPAAPREGDGPVTGEAPAY